MAIDLMSAFTETPPPIDYVLPNMIAGTVGALIAPGGAGKSILALQLATQIAGGPDLLGLGGFTTGPVIYLPAEDPKIILTHRLHALGKSLSLRQMQVISANLLIEPLIGRYPNIMENDWFDGLKKAAEGRRLMILDTLRRFHVEDENASGPMTQVIGRMEAIAVETGCSILFLHHTNKNALTNGDVDLQYASRGSSVLVDNIRWQSFLSCMTQDEIKGCGIDKNQGSYFVRFGMSKENYGPPITDRWLQRHEGGVLKHVELKSRCTTSGKSRLKRLKNEIRNEL
ncbi:helicase RepA family protein [Oceanisphaera sediminis]|uniref:Helicase RepA family protein n=1 Tax=Oceanisphaera sediminis TaxID=981381 RepID=A0ABP7DXJ9_9GAMM